MTSKFDITKDNEKIKIYLIDEAENINQILFIYPTDKIAGLGYTGGDDEHCVVVFFHNREAAEFVLDTKQKAYKFMMELDNVLSPKICAPGPTKVEKIKVVK